MEQLVAPGAQTGRAWAEECAPIEPTLLWSLVGSDAILAGVCLLTALGLIARVRPRVDAALHPAVWWCSVLAGACAVTQVADVWAIWHPVGGWQAATRIGVAVAALCAARTLWPLMAKARQGASQARLQAAMVSLEAEVQRRNDAEAQVAEIQQNLAVTLASIDAGFIATDRDGRVTRMNAVAERVTGCAQSDACQQPLWQVFRCEGGVPTALGEEPVKSMQALGITVDQVHHCEVMSVDGTRRPVEMRAALTCAEDGAVLGLVMIFRDLSSQRQAEVESSQLAAIVESSNDAIVGKTLEGRITSWNRAAQAMFGYSADEAIGQSVQMLIPLERANEEQHILECLSNGEKVPAFDTVRLAKDGRRLDVSITVSPILDRAGRIIGASKIARDVTRQRRAEWALRTSQARLRFTLESAAIGDWDLDIASGRIQRSLRHDRCFGYDTVQPEWSLDALLAHVHPDDRREVSRGVHHALLSALPWHVQCRVIWPDATEHWISLDAKAQLEDGHATHLLGIVTEITQQKQAESVRLKAQRLEAENQQIQEASRLKSLFLANMSHELRTPLNAVIGFADLLRSGAVPAESPQHDQFLGHIGTSGRHLLQLINDVLDLSKVESGKFEFFPAPLVLTSLVSEVLDVLHPDIQRKHLRVHTDIDAQLSGLHLDGSRLKQVLYNYLSNAIKFTPEAGVISVHAMAQGPDHFKLEVRDSGIGISAQDVPRLFTEFQQLDAGYSKQHQGSGLGLALTRRLVEAQGGSVGVHSTPGVGSVFHVVLNRVHGTDAQRAQAGRAGALALDGGPLLMVHAERHLQDMVHAAQANGWQVHGASTGTQALAQALSHVYAAITLDLRLPDRPGLEVLEGIRQDSPSRDSPVVGVAMPADEGTTATFAIADVLSKPIRSDELLKVMGRFRGAASHSILVMVVDDDPRALDLMKATLTSIGIDAVCVPDGREALRQIHLRRPDALILDLMMPGMNGFDVLDALRHMPAGRELPVFIWTSMVLTDAEYARLSASARLILNKGGGTIASWLEALNQSRAASTPAALQP